MDSTATIAVAVALAVVIAGGGGFLIATRFARPARSDPDSQDAVSEARLEAQRILTRAEDEGRAHPGG